MFQEERKRLPAGLCSPRGVTHRGIREEAVRKEWRQQQGLSVVQSKQSRVVMGPNAMFSENGGAVMAKCLESLKLPKGLKL